MKLSIDLSNPQDVAEAAGLLALMQGHTGSVPAAPAPAPAAPAAPAPAAPAAPAPAPAAPAAPAPAAPAAPAPAAPAAPAGGAVDLATFSAAVQAYAKANSPQAAKAVFAQLGFTKISDVPAEQYATAITHFAV